MGHKPSSSVGTEVQIAHELMSADALFAAAHKMRRQKPFVHRDMRTLVNSPDRRGELLYTLTAAVETRARSFAVDLVGVADHTAMRANRAIRPANRLKMRPGGGFVVENRVRKVDAHLRAPKVQFLSHFRICLSSA